MNRSTALIDGTRPPTARETILTLLRHARQADIAVARIRLANLDFDRAVLHRIDRCRLLIGRFDVHSFALDTTDLDRRRSHVRGLRDFATSGRLLLRSAGAPAWTPDFSIFQLAPDARTAAGPDTAHGITLVGAHAFVPEIRPTDGPSFTIITREPHCTLRAARRFEALWDAAYDVLPVVTDALDAELRVMEARARHPTPPARRPTARPATTRAT
jgi:hypothetical protein